MEGLARLWLVCASPAGIPPATAALLASLHPAAVASPPGAELERAAGSIASAAGLEPALDPDLGPGPGPGLGPGPVPALERARSTLARWARRHDGAQLVLLCDAALVRAAAASALDLDPDSEDPAPFHPAPGSATAIDWPSGTRDDARPALAGLDLDWIPPFPPGPPVRFPGGPGSAPSGRT